MNAWLGVTFIPYRTSSELSHCLSTLSCLLVLQSASLACHEVDADMHVNVIVTTCGGIPSCFDDLREISDCGIWANKFHY